LKITHKVALQAKRAQFTYQRKVRSFTSSFLRMVIYAWFVYKQKDTQHLNKITLNLSLPNTKTNFTVGDQNETFLVIFKYCAGVLKSRVLEI